MKKILFYTLLTAVAFTTVSCDEDFNEDVAAPQTWSQEEAVTLPGFTASAVSTVDLASADSVVVFNITPSALPEGTTVDNFRLEITPDAVDGAAVVTVKTAGNGKVASADLQKIIEDNYGKRPVERTLNAKLYANLMKDGQASLLTTAPIVVKAIPEAPFIASAYYLVGDMVGWNAETMKKFTHSDKDVYEDSEFSILITTTKADQHWKVISQNNVDAGGDDFWAEGPTGVVGVAVDGDDSMSGTLVTASPQAAKISKAGMYRITLNMMDYTYEIKEIVPEYYLVGNLQGWSDAAKTCIMYPSSMTVFSYTTDFSIGGAKDPNFKIWMGSDFGNWDMAYGTAIDGDTSLEGTLVANGGAIMAPAKNEFYTLTADMVTLTYKMNRLSNQDPATYEYISLIGEFCGWNQDDNVDLDEVTPHNWYGANIELSGGELKFCANNGWDLSWGALTKGVDIGDKNYGNTTTTNGENMSVPAGTYNVFFNDITGEYVFVVVE